MIITLIGQIINFQNQTYDRDHKTFKYRYGPLTQNDSGLYYCRFIIPGEYSTLMSTYMKLEVNMKCPKRKNILIYQKSIMIWFHLVIFNEFNASLHLKLIPPGRNFKKSDVTSGSFFFYFHAF